MKYLSRPFSFAAICILALTALSCQEDVSLKSINEYSNPEGWYLPWNLDWGIGYGKFCNEYLDVFRKNGYLTKNDESKEGAFYHNSCLSIKYSEKKKPVRFAFDFENRSFDGWEIVQLSFKKDSTIRMSKKQSIDAIEGLLSNLNINIASYQLENESPAVLSYSADIEGIKCEMIINYNGVVFNYPKMLNLKKKEDALKRKAMDFIEKFLKTRLHDPSSYQSVSWSDLKRDPDGDYYLTHKYRAKNGYGALRLEEHTFFFDINCNPTSVR